MTTPFDISKSKYVDVPNGRNAADPAEKMIAPYIMERRKNRPFRLKKPNCYISVFYSIPQLSKEVYKNLKKGKMKERNRGKKRK